MRLPLLRPRLQGQTPHLDRTSAFDENLECFVDLQNSVGEGGSGGGGGGSGISCLSDDDDDDDDDDQGQEKERRGRRRRGEVDNERRVGGGDGRPSRGGCRTERYFYQPR